jgi:hypothetical protein
MEIRTILLNDDPDWEFFPERYTERKCQIQYDQRRRTNQNHKHQNHTCGGIGSECVVREKFLIQILEILLKMFTSFRVETRLYISLKEEKGLLVETVGKVM